MDVTDNSTTPQALNRFSLEGKTAVVTGGSSGIGRAITELFAADGADVVACSRTLADVEAVADEIAGSARPGEVHPVECDVTDRDDVEALAEAANDAFGGVDVLVNNAGGAGGDPFDEVTPEAWRQVLDVNLTGTYNCTRVFGDALKESGGSVVNIGSMAGQYGVSGMTPYSAAKSAVSTFTRALAAEWDAEGVRLNAVAPGFVGTEKVRDNLGVDREIDRSRPDRNIGTPGEVADLVRFLASPAASFVDGETVEITGTPLVYGPGELAE
ncbi:SDR family NAD(P)-dependent oxidoreductase [Halorussus limi]|uniref:SDR family NAD(P)-dependent oxidoreductase n=1 Tax=Halorussus limi TaxID=2938695 RepID=UPI003F5FFAB3